MKWYHLQEAEDSLLLLSDFGMNYVKQLTPPEILSGTIRTCMFPLEENSFITNSSLNEQYFFIRVL